MKLTAKQKAAVERWCYAELAELAGSDFGDAFKDRYETQPDEFNIDEDESMRSQDVADAADDYFFVVMSRLAKEFRKKGKAS